MTGTDSFEALGQQRKLQEQQIQHLHRIAHEWEPAVRNGLKHLAQTIWPNGHLLGVIPVSRYRLRWRNTSNIYIWWIEHDIPPYDRYWCAAYRVQLSLNGSGKPSLTLESGSTIRPVKPLTVEKLETVLAQAAEDLPLLIPRQMGQASDP
jgi:hypothetical protein